MKSPQENPRMIITASGPYPANRRDLIQVRQCPQRCLQEKETRPSRNDSHAELRIAARRPLNTIRSRRPDVEKRELGTRRTAGAPVGNVRHSRQALVELKAASQNIRVEFIRPTYHHG